ncbi:uncharacterized protein cd79b [Esox lucius]|uniref:Ig-like domain-containing protein n=1 Tax=Esox lucius TaxID=8010 RepID=A0AAY5LAA2_ESOLU|nr:uncharacterized protein cd79b [Esox lucius]
MFTTMYWLLVAYLGLIFCNLSEGTFQLSQNPRFIGMNPGRKVCIYCKVSPKNPKDANVNWYKAPKYKTEADNRNKLQMSNYIKIINQTNICITSLTIEDSGVYFCQIDNTWGPGTEIQVSRRIHFEAAQRRSNFKDVLIFVQGSLLMLMILVPLLRRRTLGKKEEAIYEEPEHDHIYEGLAIEHCGDFYEDISVYAQHGPAEAAAAWKQE